MGRLSVFGFKIYDTQPKPKPLSFPANYYKFQIKSNKISSRYGPNPSRSYESRRYPTKSQSDLLFPFNLDGANQISTPVIKPEANSNQPEIDKTQTKKSDQISQVNFGSNFHPHESFMSSSGWAQTQPDLIRG